MSSSYGQCSLFLHPGQYDFSLEDISLLISALQEIGFISHEINEQQANNNYYTGERFLDYIAYMGCAPAIQFEASEADDDFCYIKIHQLDSAKLIYSQTQARAPHCPHCKKAVNSWQQNRTSTAILCNHCHTTSNIEDFNWRRMAGYAQLFIEITDIFPKEAMPQQSLLDKLTNIFDTDWQYFYSCR